MSEKELIEQARREGATHYSELRNEFYRPVPGGWEYCHVSADGLSQWRPNWLAHPPESAVRL